MQLRAKNMCIRTARAGELIDLSEFVATLNGQSQHNISYFGTEAEDILSALRVFIPSPAESVLVLQKADEIIGMFGFDADEVLGRAWLYGPLINMHSDMAWHHWADALYSALTERIPPHISDWELVFDRNNQRGCEFALRHGFATAHEHLVLQLDRAWVDLAGLSVMGASLDETDYSAFVYLHNSLFPGTYYSGEEILNRLEKHSQVYVYKEGGLLVGYCYAELTPQLGEGSIEFIGVAPEFRGRGIGFRLMGEIIQWMFGFRDVHRIELTVEASNKAAIQLYRKIGFNTLKHIVAFRRA